MNNKVFGTISTATWATGDEIGRQFDVLNSISRGKESSVIDVCDLCKNGSVQMSPDSIINIEEGCRCKAKEAPNLTTGGGVIDIADMANDGLGSQQLREDIVNEEMNENNNYVSEQKIDEQKIDEKVEQPIIDEKNDEKVEQPIIDEKIDEKVEQPIIDEKVEQPIIDEQKNDEKVEQPIIDEQKNDEIQVVGVDKGAVEKFCTGHMSPIEYSINIVIIILFISISVMAIMLIFKLSMKCCSCDCCNVCGKCCKEMCSKCKKCMNCCECSSNNNTTLNGGYRKLYLRPSISSSSKPHSNNISSSKPHSNNISSSKPHSNNISSSKPSSRLTGVIF